MIYAAPLATITRLLDKTVKSPDPIAVDNKFLQKRRLFAGRSFPTLNSGFGRVFGAAQQEIVHMDGGVTTRGGSIVMASHSLIRAPDAPPKCDSAEMLARAKSFIRFEASALNKLAEGLTDQLCIAANALLLCRGKVVLSGVGKSRLIGAKISATLSSTGTPSVTLDPTDALHGDLGRLGQDDILIALSNSGESRELRDLIACVRLIPIKVIAMTGNPRSSLATSSDIVLTIGALEEACPLGLAPTTSTTAMMALGDALALVVLERRGFTREDFARLHPAGALGKRLIQLHQGAAEDLPVS